MIYFRIKFASNKNIHETIDINKWWLKHINAGLWVRATQASDPIVLGWMLYSVRNMEMERWSAIFTNICNCEVGCQWKVIHHGRGKNNGQGPKVRALHLETDRNKDKNKATRALKKYYSSVNASDSPDNMKMRLVPDAFLIRNTKTKADVDRLKKRQDFFNTHIGESSNPHVSGLDSEIRNRSLRSLLMNMQSKNFPGKSLFHMISPHWSEDGLQFYFLPDVRSKAENLNEGLLTYLRAKEAPEHKGSR